MLELSLRELLTRDWVQRISAVDSVKNRAELMSGEINATENASDSRQTLATIWAHWRAEPGTQLIPGHDLAMRLGAKANLITWTNAKWLLLSGSPNVSATCGPSTYAVTQALALLTGALQRDRF
jgi:hypothetical protein